MANLLAKAKPRSKPNSTEPKKLGKGALMRTKDVLKA
jgi:hypothetical protein